MPVVLSAKDLGHAFGAGFLFQHVSFTLVDGERVGLIGPNGSGKSTLLKILCGIMPPDRGEVAKKTGLRVSYLPQVVELAGCNIRQAVGYGLSDTGELTWEEQGIVDAWLNRLELEGERPLAGLSGGQQKRVGLARALVSEPELLLLDEPTNHLDVEAILWLERHLAGARCATMTVTHDRLFLQRVAKRILELDRKNPDGIWSVDGDYATYVERKAEALVAEERRQDALRNRLRRETEWLRRGPPARSTKQAARRERAQELAEEVATLRVRQQIRTLALDFAGSSANDSRHKRLIEAKEIGHYFGDRYLFKGLELLITPETRLGLMGPNGCGKSTLLRILAGKVQPREGSVWQAPGLTIAYFEQNRDSLDPNQTLAQSVCPEGDSVIYRGVSLHRHGYLERFLFRPDQMGQPVSSLSGGEQSRLVMARLMLQPAQVLILDEPTNDLDLPTLIVLEEALKDFDGAVMLVTHDRYFLDQVCSRILAFSSCPGEPGTTAMLSDLSQWEIWHQEQTEKRISKPVPRPEPRSEDPPRKKKLGYLQQRELDGMEERITVAEARFSKLDAECNHPDVVCDAARLVVLCDEMAEARAEIDRLYARWAELTQEAGD